MKILLSGINGHMGREVAKLAKSGMRGASLALGVDINPVEQDGVKVYSSFASVPADADFDCIIDFSHHACTKDLIDFAKKVKVPTIIATTGQTDEEKQMIFDAAKEAPVFFSYNYSLGIALLVELAKKTASAFPDAEIEIIEQHHDRKVDAPSGTAIMLCDAIRSVRPSAYPVVGRSGQGKRTPDEIGVHAIRMGNIVGIHEVMVSTQTQTITLKHEAYTRALFAEGAISAAAFMQNKGLGLYSMADIVKA